MNEKELELEGQELVDVSLDELLKEFNIDDEWLEETVTIPAQEPVEVSVDIELEPVEETVSQEIPEVKIPEASVEESAEDTSEEPAEETVEEAVQEIAEEIPEVATEEIQEEAPKTTVTDDTVRLNDVREAVARQTAVTEDTVPLENISDAVVEEEDVSDDTVRLDDLSEVDSAEDSALGQRLNEEEEEVPPAPVEEVRREPIVFDPRARMRELKRQIIAGPEKRYYELTEKGVLKYQMGMLMCILVIAASACISVFFDTGVISEVAIALLPTGIDIGDRLKFEDYEFTLL